jgi:hypothetical protein
LNEGLTLNDLLVQSGGLNRTQGSKAEVAVHPSEIDDSNPN